MYKLTRISLINWYLVSAQDIEVRDATALLGPTGAGKSSIQDAIQTVLCGGSGRWIRTNASTDSKRSDRRIVDYCLGYMMPKADGGRAIRESCETIIALTFSEERADGTRHDVSVGIAYQAREEPNELTRLNRFIAPGHAFSVSDWFGHDAQGAYIQEWADIEKGLIERCDVRYYRSNTDEKFVADMLAEMRQHGRQPDAKHFLRVFSNAVAFEPIKDPTRFVRQWILTPDPLEVDRVRASIARWREMNETVERIERRLNQVRATQRLYQTWSNLLIERASKEWRYACAGTALQKLHLKGFAAAHQKLRDEMALLRKQIEARGRRVEEEERHLKDLKDQLQERGVEAKINAAEKDMERARERLQRLEADCRELRDVFLGARNFKEGLEWLPPQGERSLALASSALSLMDEGSGASWLRHHKPEVANCLAEVQAFSNKIPDLIGPDMEETLSQIRALRTERDAISANLERAGRGQVMLSRGPAHLIEMLAEEGIEATPLCEVVEIKDESWQQAFESLLGRAREALIVDPEHLRRAHNILHHNRHKRDLGGCMLVKTTQTHTVDLFRTNPNSIASIAKSDNQHALAFIEVRIGGFLKVETEEELDRSQRAVMRNGKRTSGLAYSAHPDVPLIIGQKARMESLRSMQERKTALEAELKGLNRVSSKLQNLSYLARRLSEQTFDLDEMEDTSLSVEREIQEAAKRREAAIGEEDAALAQEVESLKRDIREMNSEIKELNEDRFKLSEKAGAAGNKVTSARTALRVAVKAQREALKRRAEEDLLACLELEDEAARSKVFAPYPFAGQRLPVEVGRGDSEELQRFYAGEQKKLEVELRGIQNDIPSAANKAHNSMNDYLRNNALEWPFTTGQHLHSQEYGWVAEERKRLESNELRQYQEEAREAERTMRVTLTEDLLVNLHSKFQRLDHQLRSLNNQLTKHRFNNRYHAFRKKPDPAYEDLRMLASRVGESTDMAEAVIEGRTDDPWLEEALRKLNELLEDTGGEGLEDYRNYFTFDLYMRLDASDDGEIEISQEEIQSKKLMSLSGRAAVGSGGEGQTPFYIAIAASMALAYYPGGNRGKEAAGMGLVLFDEAFSKLDIQTTQSLIRFFDEMGLQIVIAAPEQNRVTFSEVMDTILVINKDEPRQVVYIDSEFPKDHARRELAKINPDWVGVEGYRKKLAAESHAAE